MSLRTKVLLPLAFFSLLMIGYLYGYWMPRSVEEITAEYQSSTERHLESVIVGLTPLLLGHQIDTIYENLDELQKNSSDWVGIELKDDRGRSLYPLGSTSTQATTASKNGVHVLQKRLDYLGMNLGTLTVRVDFARRLSMIQKQQNQLAAVMLIVIMAFILSAWYVLERLVIRPVKALSRASSELTQNRFEGPPLEKTGDDEVGHLVDSFSEMRDAIRVYQTALQKSEARFRQALDNLLEGCMILGFDWTYLYMNETSAQHGMNKRENLVGRTLLEMYPGVEKSGVFAHYRSCMEERVPQRFEESFSFADGTTTWYAFSVEPVPEGIFVLSLDITERKRAENALRSYKDQLEVTVQQRTSELLLSLDAAQAASKAKSAFLANMSHELRTPLNAILGFSSMMRRDPEASPAQRDSLDIINRSGEHLLTLINDVLEMAKIEAGRVQLESAPFDLGGLVRDVTDMMHVRAQEKGLQLLTHQSSEFPRYIKGDESRLRQVLINLVGNAVKFTQHGSVTVRFGVKPHVMKHHLVIEVEDSGPGISLEDQQRIFEPFVQLGQTATQKGTGLGLTITKQFVELMGGTLNVESALGKGSIFRVELPLERVAEGDVVKLERVEEREIVGLAPNQAEYRILIVEDQLENQLLLSKLMESVGIPFKVAENGEQGVQLFQSWHPHLIWMDRRMPVMDGLEATRRIRELPGGKEVKIVAVTASAFLEQRAEMLKAGMDDFVRKPYRLNEIYECMTRQLGVQYTYADTHEAEETGNAILTPEMLTGLPPDLRHELQEALKALESERIAAAIEQVAPLDAKVHKTLSHLAENFDYPAILKALRTS